MTSNDDELTEITCQTTKRSYKIERILGGGGYTTCYEVHSNGGERQPKVMACKVIRNEPHELASIQKENSILKSLNHRNILRWIDFFSDEMNCYIFTELCDGGNMFKIIEDRHQLPDSLKRSLLIQSIEAIDYIHNRGIIHRDIKPENFFITVDHKVKLGDFGMAIEEECARHESGIFGSPGFYSPEMINDTYGKETDIWSFGCVVYFVLAHRLLEYPAYVTEKFLKIPRCVGKCGSALIMQLLVVEPRERLTPREIKTHPFFQETDEKDDKRIDGFRNIDLMESFDSCSGDDKSGQSSVWMDDSLEGILFETRSIIESKSGLLEDNIAYFSYEVPLQCFIEEDD